MRSSKPQPTDALLDNGVEFALQSMAELIAAELRAGKTTNARWFLKRATPEQRRQMRARLRELRARG